METKISSATAMQVFYQSLKSEIEETYVTHGIMGKLKLQGDSIYLKVNGGFKIPTAIAKGTTIIWLDKFNLPESSYSLWDNYIMTSSHNHYLLLMECYYAMLQINPERLPSHPVEDWVGENFIDRVRNEGGRTGVEQIIKFWKHQNSIS